MVLCTSWHFNGPAKLDQLSLKADNYGHRPVRTAFFRVDCERLNQIHFAGLAFADAFESNNRIVRPFTGVEAPGSFQSLDAVDKSINGPCMGVIVNPAGAAGVRTTA